MKVSVKVVGASGQISLGKEYAGRQVLVEESGFGVWTVRTATVVPDNERWLHTQEVAAGLSRSLAWAAENPAQPTDLSTIKRKLEHDETSSAKRERAKGQSRYQQPRVSKKLVHT
jgi:ABC-type nitrate/sulfonate/bicarbonate transport system substrate-binding protein